MEILTSIWQVVSGAYSSYGAAILQIIGGCAAIAALTPNKIDDTIFKYLYKGIDLIGMNWGRAKNADAK